MISSQAFCFGSVDMDFNTDAAVKYLDEHKAQGSTGHCARYVRLALQAGGVDTGGFPVFAKDYADHLSLRGFESVDTDHYQPAAGDIVVIQPYKGGSVAGHIAMYTGTEWISDFKQRDMWGGPGYRSAKPSYRIFRFKKKPPDAGIAEVRLP
jgi:type VI secretion system secreted protein VgrG